MSTENKDTLIITRIFDAPREQVWKAWTDPEHLKKWWGPKDFTAPVIKMDLQVGGKYHWCMRGTATPGGEIQDFWTVGIFKEIIPMKKLVYTDNFADKDGNIIKASDYGLAGEWPEVSEVTVTFEDMDNTKTKMTLRHIGLPSGTMSEMTGVGWNQSFDKMVKSLAKPTTGKNILKSIVAILAGFITVVILSIVTDIIMEAISFFPPQNKPELYTAGLLLIAFIYRSIYTIAGGYVAAALAPGKPMRHAIILGALGMVMGTLGAVANWDKTAGSGAWYPIALVIAAIPCTWLGGKLFEMAKNKK
jgi:uncharacterized protein YndB with AHSA1/START domain